MGRRRLTSIRACAAPRSRQLELVFVAVVCAAATVVFGVYPGPLFDIAQDAGEALKNLV